jgi:hypothetical protein
LFSPTLRYVTARLRPQDGQIDVRLPTVDYGIGILAGPLGRGSISHYDLKINKIGDFDRNIISQCVHMQITIPGV